jgi:hypothetical protein
LQALPQFEWRNPSTPLKRMTLVALESSALYTVAARDCQSRFLQATEMTVQ